MAIEIAFLDVGQICFLWESVKVEVCKKSLNEKSISLVLRRLNNRTKLPENWQ